MLNICYVFNIELFKTRIQMNFLQLTCTLRKKNINIITVQIFTSTITKCSYPIKFIIAISIQINRDVILFLILSRLI